MGLGAFRRRHLHERHQGPLASNTSAGVGNQSSSGVAAASVVVHNMAWCEVLGVAARPHHDFLSCVIHSLSRQPRPNSSLSLNPLCLISSSLISCCLRLIQRVIDNFPLSISIRSLPPPSPLSSELLLRRLLLSSKYPILLFVRMESTSVVWSPAPYHIISYVPLRAVPPVPHLRHCSSTMDSDCTRSCT